MNPNRVDFTVDLLYGVAIFLAVILMVVVGTDVGIAFAFGVLLSYVIHVGWKMARFDPEWMTQEVAEQVEETITEEVKKTVGDTVGTEVDRMAEQVERNVTQEVADEVEKVVSEHADETEGTSGEST